jgi:hypothetical protein
MCDIQQNDHGGGTTVVRFNGIESGLGVFFFI